MQTKLAVFILLMLNIVILTSLFAQDKYEIRRVEMIRKQIESRGIKDETVLQVMNKVKRHLFVSPGYENNAYEDRPLPIGYGQTISQPYIVAYMTDLLNVGSEDTVLEIGTGSGYQAAVLAEIVKQVYSIEIVEELGLLARERLKTLNFNNVEVKIDDGFYGWKEHAPFDGIIVTAASEYVPPFLVEQLKDGGKMIIPIGSPFSVQSLMMITKKGTEITTKNLLPVRFVTFTRKK